MERERLLADLFERMMRMRRLLMAMHAKARPGTPTHAQLGVLMLLAHEHRSVKDVAGIFGLTSSAVTQMVNGLVHDGLLARKPDKLDRRKLRLMLTAKGRSVLAKAKASHQAAMREILQPLTDEELAQLTALQGKIIAHLHCV